MEPATFENYTPLDGLDFADDDNDWTQTARTSLLDLHDTLYTRMRKQRWELVPFKHQAGLTVNYSVSCAEDHSLFALSYVRPHEQSCLIERLMGKDDCRTPSDLDIYCHPVIELRVTPEHFTVELIISPFAWWDQQNLMGKMTIDRQRDELRTLLKDFNDESRFGFWEGSRDIDMSVTTWQLLRGSVLDDWMATFAAGQDCFRAGMWYDTATLFDGSEEFVQDVLRHVKMLYDLHQFVNWSSDNNYHGFCA